MNLPSMPTMPKPKTPDHIDLIGMVCAVVGLLIVLYDVPWLGGLLLLIAGLVFIALAYVGKVMGAGK